MSRSEPGAEKLYYRIGEVAQLVGVDSHVLRYWESEFGLTPTRSNSGQRLYRKEDLAQYLRIKHLLHDQGYTIAGARKVLSGEVTPNSSVDVAQVRRQLTDAVQKLGELQERIRAMRDEFRPPSRL